MILSVYHWAIAHPEAAFSIAAGLVALLRSVYTVVSRAVQPYPRARAAIEAVAALAPDVLRFVVMVLRACGVRYPAVMVDVRDDEIATLRARVAELAAAQASPPAEPPRATQETP